MNNPLKKKAKAASTAQASSRRRTPAPKDDLRPHYDFDPAKSRPNRFAEAFNDGVVAVVLDADVAAVFRSSEAVNTFLRSAISAMPQEPAKKRRAS